MESKATDSFEVTFPSNTSTIQSRDVLLGKESDCVNHSGTIAFRILVAVRSKEYMGASQARSGKTEIIIDVANDILSTGARFMKRGEDSSPGIDCWRVLHPKEIHTKIGNSFRDAVKAHHKYRSLDKRINMFRGFRAIIRYFLSRQDKQSITYAHVLVEVLESKELLDKSNRLRQTVIVQATPQPARPKASTNSSEHHDASGAPPHNQSSEATFLSSPEQSKLTEKSLLLLHQERSLTCQSRSERFEAAGTEPIPQQISVFGRGQETRRLVVNSAPTHVLSWGPPPAPPQFNHMDAVACCDWLLKWVQHEIDLLVDT